MLFLTSKTVRINIFIFYLKRQTPFQYAISIVELFALRNPSFCRRPEDASASICSRCWRFYRKSNGADGNRPPIACRKSATMHFSLVPASKRWRRVGVCSDARTSVNITSKFQPLSDLSSSACYNTVPQMLHLEFFTPGRT